MSDALPAGFRVRLRQDLLHADDGEVLVGGSPARAVRLSQRAQELLADGRLTVDGPATAALARRLLAGNLADPDLSSLDASPEQLTVVVPVRDRAQQLERCLAALAPLPVIVVDDASRDPEAVARVAGRCGAKLVRLASNVGPAGARNAGLAQVHTPLVAFVDSDVVVDSASLLDLARHCHDPMVALVGPRVAGEVGSGAPRWFERYDAVASSMDQGGVGGQVWPGATIGWLPSACLVGRVEHLRAHGAFDADLRVAEDVDLVWRLVVAGLVVRYDPSVRAGHDVRGAFSSWLGRKAFYGTGGAELGKRHGDRIAPAVLSPTTALGALALLQRRWWSLPAVAATTAVTASSLARRLPLHQDGASVAVRLTGRGLGSALRQESDLLLRHWWPAVALGAAVSSSVRRAVVTALVVDVVATWRQRDGVGPLTWFVGRRADDLAYGAGLWWGAVRSRNLRCLLPRRATRG